MRKKELIYENARLLEKVKVLEDDYKHLLEKFDVCNHDRSTKPDDCKEGSHCSVCVHRKTMHVPIKPANHHLGSYNLKMYTYCNYGNTCEHFATNLVEVEE